jgi:signal transduction histidine kinase
MPSSPEPAALGVILAAMSKTVAPSTVAGPVQAALDAAVRGIATLATVDEVLQVIVDRVRPLVDARYAALGIVDETGRIERFVTSGIDEESRRRIGALPQGHGLLGLIIRENRSFRIPDISKDPRRHGFPPNHPPMKSFLGVPITTKGTTVGRLYLTEKTTAPEFSEEDQALVETFALHAGIAMENARLHEQVRRLAVVDERERISKDLHDGIIQNMYAVSLSLEDVPDLMTEDQAEAEARVERAIDSIHMSIQDIRNFIFGLRPELLEGMSLGAGLAALIEEYRHSATVDFDLRIPDPPPELPNAVTSQLLAVATEALSNIVRHSGASAATIEVQPIATDMDGWQLRIEDNGVGFDIGPMGRFGHQGLTNMRERAAQLGSEVRIDSQPGMGTTVTVQVPIAVEGEVHRA